MTGQDLEDPAEQAVVIEESRLQEHVHLGEKIRIGHRQAVVDVAEHARSHAARSAQHPGMKLTRAEQL